MHEPLKIPILVKVPIFNSPLHVTMHRIHFSFHEPFSFFTDTFDFFLAPWTFMTCLAKKKIVFIWPFGTVSGIILNYEFEKN